MNEWLNSPYISSKPHLQVSTKSDLYLNHLSKTNHIKQDFMPELREIEIADRFLYLRIGEKNTTDIYCKH